MAGKTFPGIGELEDESPPADSPPVDPAGADDSGVAESRPFYSGPTVVDDLKVEEGLKKLRSLDAPLGPLTGITKAVVDALETGPTRTNTPMAVDLSQLTPAPAKVVPNQLRETAVGRNVVGPTVGQQEIPPPFDDRALRGTLFGHSIHAPEFALPAPEEPPPAGALALANRGAPTKTVVIYHPDHPPLRDDAPSEAEPYQRSDRYRNTPLTPMAVRGSTSRKKVFTRVAIGAAGILAIVAAALFWARPSDDSDSSAAANRAPPPQPPVAAPPAPPPQAAAPPVAAPPVAAAKEPEPEPMPAVTPPAHPFPAVARPVARHVAEPSDPEGEATGPDAHPHHSRPAASHVDRRHPAPQTDKNDTDAPPAKAHKRATEDDPDATMAPSIE
jgi:hypothetical protein